MEQFFIEVYEFLTSTQFTMYLTMGLAIFSVVTKIATTIKKARDKIKIANLENKVKIKEKELQAVYAQNDTLKQETETYKIFINEIWKAITQQNDALGVAFDNSNLNASAKLVVRDKLKLAENLLAESHATAIQMQSTIKETIDNVVEIVKPIKEEIEEYKRVK